MMPVRPLCLALFCCLALAAQTLLAQTQNPAQDHRARGQQETQTYTQLVERAKKGDASVDFLQLRDAFAAWAGDRKNQTDPPDRDAMVAAFKEKNYAKAVALAEVVLDYEFVNRGLHLAVADAYLQLGDETRASFHRDVAGKLLKALLSTGDGKSAETAYRVMNIREEYQIMHELGLQVSSQSLLSIKNRPYDVLTGKDPKTGKTVEMYFDISSFF